MTTIFRIEAVLLLVAQITVKINCMDSLPLVINTWNFVNATHKAWEVVYNSKGSSLDAVEDGCSVCEVEQCDGTVGYGGSPDEDGETTLDAMIMDGPTHNVGAVGALRRVKSAISVARHVLENTQHTILVGDQATKFAVSMGFKEEDLSTNVSKKMYEQWKANSCQPNFWQNVYPDPAKRCGPYRPVKLRAEYNFSEHKDWNIKNQASRPIFGKGNHDTVGMVVIDTQGRIAAGTSTNGAKFKIPGRVGDSPMVGSGAYVDQDVGGAAGTGDGDILMRFLPSYQTVENMRQGMDPSAAAEEALRRITKKYSSFVGAIVATTIDGRFGAACYGIPTFPFSVCNPQLGKVTVKTVQCLTL